MNKVSSYYAGVMCVGLDAHKVSINVAMLRPGENTPVEWQMANEPRAIRRMVGRVVREAGGAEVRFCYEAGPCGYALQREIQEAGPVVCDVIAPSLIPAKPGERIKTDRRDARKLAELYRAGLLTVVRPPTPEEEAVRDLCRCREDAKEDLGRSRHRLGKLLLRRGLIFSGKAWTQAHRQWLKTLQFEGDADRIVFEDYLLAITQLEERVKSLEQSIEAIAQREPYSNPVGRLRCFKGIDTITAMTLVAELHTIRRFQSARGLMSFVGLVPSEYSSGESKRRGGITKAGNGHVRRVLIESAWHYRHRPSVGPSLSKRREGQSARIIAIADKAQQRLHRRFLQMESRGKPRNKSVVAVARELTGFIWASLVEALQPEGFEGKGRGSSPTKSAPLQAQPRRKAVPSQGQPSTRRSRAA